MSAATTASSPNLVLADLIPGARVRDAALVVGGTALMAGLAQVAIQVAPSPVPITGQTLAVGLIGATLGLRRGTAAMVLYVFLGLFLPIYSAGGHGWSVVNGPGGGYIVGFVFATAAIGWLAERGADRRILNAFTAFVVEQLIVFAFGLAGLKLATGQDWGWVIHNGFSIFIIGGIVKAIIGALVLPGAWRAVRGFERRG
jgi:biotin transport system substrate-specific component